MIERCNQDVTMMTRAALTTAGMPSCFWEFAAPHQCFMDNTEGWDKSSYFLTHGVPFEGHRLPFGCKVRFFPANTKKSHEDLKWDSEGQIGVFAGYDLHSGHKWSGSYLVWHLDEFRNVCLARDAHSLEGGLCNPHVTDTIWVVEGPDEFPLKAKYDRTNGTIEGREEAQRAYADDSLVPPDHVEAPVGGGDLCAANVPAMRAEPSAVQMG